MLVLRRKAGEGFYVGDIHILVSKIYRGQVKLAIDVDKKNETLILRDELKGKTGTRKKNDGKP